MPLFPNASTYFKGKSHTQLVISEGNAPAERYIPSAATNADIKMQYEFGPEGNQGVVIPKGKAVALAGVEWDYETEKYVPALKIADGTTDIPIGVNHHNVYKRIRDRFSGNQPTVITREYIEVPFFTTEDQANAINFGAAHLGGLIGTASGTDTYVSGVPGDDEIALPSDKIAQANAILGKPIKVDQYGNYTVAVKTDGTIDAGNTAVIGTCLGVETDIPPAGYLQYFMEMSDNDFTNFLQQMSHAPSAGRTTDADWNDVGTYPEGTSYLKSRADLIKNFQAGIPFLTDGYFKARTTLEDLTLNSSEVVDVKVQGKVTQADDSADVVINDVIGAAIYIRFDTKTAKFAKDVVKEDIITLSGFTGLTAEHIHIDYTNNQVVIYPQTAETVTVAIEELEVTANQIPGIPTGWDFANSLGGVRILLQK